MSLFEKKKNNEVDVPPKKVVIPEKIKKIFENHINDIKKIMYDSLINIETRYSDSSTYQKCEKALITMFESEGIDYSDTNKRVLMEIFRKSEIFSAFGRYLVANLSYYHSNVIENNWIWSKKNEMLNFIIDYSIKDNHPLSKQYARLLFGRYFYNKYKKNEYTENEEKIICKSLLATVSSEEFSSWFMTPNDVVENVVSKAIGRVERLADKYRFDDKIVIQQLFASNLFKNYCIKHVEIVDKIKKSRFSQIYESSLTLKQSSSLAMGQIKDNDDSSVDNKNIKITKEQKIVNDIDAVKNNVDLKENESIDIQKTLNEKESIKAVVDTSSDINKSINVEDEIESKTNKTSIKIQISDLDKFLKSIGSKEKQSVDYTNDFFDACYSDLIEFEKYYDNISD